MTDRPEPKNLGGSFFAFPQPRAGRIRLAHWPPPFRSGRTQPKIIHHDASEKPKLAKPRGWRLTRALFSEFSDD